MFFQTFLMLFRKYKTTENGYIAWFCVPSLNDLRQTNVRVQHIVFQYNFLYIFMFLIHFPPPDFQNYLFLVAFLFLLCYNRFINPQRRESNEKYQKCTVDKKSQTL